MNLLFISCAMVPRGTFLYIIDKTDVRVRYLARYRIVPGLHIQVPAFAHFSILKRKTNVHVGGEYHVVTFFLRTYTDVVTGDFLS